MIISRDLSISLSRSAALASFLMFAGCAAAATSGIPPRTTQRDVAPTAAPTTGPTQSPAGITEGAIFTGTLAQRDQYFFPATDPLPATFSRTGVTLTIAPSSSVPPASVPTNAKVVHSVELDTTALETTELDTDSYLGAIASDGSTKQILYGSVVSDGLQSASDTVATTFAGAPVIDQSPAAEGRTWQVSPAATIVEKNATSLATRIVASDGAYAEQQTLPLNVSGTIVENSDGSGSYQNTSRAAWGYAGDVGPGSATITLGAPVATTVGTTQIPVTVTSDVNPFSFHIADLGVWYPQPLSLYAQTVTQHIAPAFSPACRETGLADASTATVTHQVDSILGLVSDTTSTAFVAGGRIVCVTMHGVTTAYFDYSGDQNAGISILGYLDSYVAVAFHTEMQHVTTLDETLDASPVGTSPAASGRGFRATLGGITPAFAAQTHFQLRLRAAAMRARKTLRGDDLK